MTTTAVVTMIFTLGLIMGGFAYFLFLAMRNEKQKNNKHGQN